MFSYERGVVCQPAAERVGIRGCGLDGCVPTGHITKPAPGPNQHSKVKMNGPDAAYG